VTVPNPDHSGDGGVLGRRCFTKEAEVVVALTSSLTGPGKIYTTCCAAEFWGFTVVDYTS
jgi:hypothetical protein